LVPAKPLLSCWVRRPKAIYIDASDRIYIVDQLNKRLSVWQYLNADYLPVTLH